MSRVFYRIAAVLIALLDIGHSAGYPWSDPAWGVDLHAMQSSRFNLFGASRTYWDFYVGFGLTVSLFLLLAAVLAWQLGEWSTDNPRRVRPTASVLLCAFAALTLLNYAYFFVIPIVLAAAITVSLAAAVSSTQSLL